MCLHETANRHIRKYLTYFIFIPYRYRRICLSLKICCCCCLFVSFSFTRSRWFHFALFHESNSLWVVYIVYESCIAYTYGIICVFFLLLFFFFGFMPQPFIYTITTYIPMLWLCVYLCVFSASVAAGALSFTKNPNLIVWLENVWW